MDRGDWRAIVHRVAKSRTWLSDSTEPHLLSCVQTTQYCSDSSPEKNRPQGNSSSTSQNWEEILACLWKSDWRNWVDKLKRRKAKHLSLIWKSKELLYSQEGSEVDWHRGTFLEHMNTRNHELDFSRTFQQSETSKGEIVFSCVYVCFNKDWWSRVGLL